MVVDFKPRSLASEVPKLTPQLRQKLSGSIECADNTDVITETLRANPMRLMICLQCHACYFRWQAPKVGACPECHNTTWVERVEKKVCMAARL